MALQTKRRTKSSVKRRRSHHALKKIGLSVCPKCKKEILPYRACAFCGTYKGREVLKIKAKNSSTSSEQGKKK
ncbi:MAG: 50S ribosomal protein L32 [bacterium]